jgi:methyl-accepting chemotaxis protein
MRLEAQCAVSFGLMASGILVAAMRRETAVLALVMVIALGFLAGRWTRLTFSGLADTTRSIAQGDLAVRCPRLGRWNPLSPLIAELDAMIAALSLRFATLSETSVALTRSTNCVRGIAEHVDGRLDRQTQQTEHAASALQQMSASITEVSRHTQSAAETARCAAQTARQGGATVADVLEAMQTIAVAVSETNAMVELLGEDSRRIAHVTTVIDDIAKKTNLLALNAAIEAARAGDQGKGFGVVAGEVRRLAESTAAATGQIATMIEAVQTRTRSALTGMEQGAKLVDSGIATTARAGESLERIIGMAERVDRMIEQIAIATAQQAMAADESSASLHAIHSLSDENREEIAAAAAGIQVLGQTVSQLEQQLGGLRFQGS